MENKILQELLEIKKMLQDIHSILELKEIDINVPATHDVQVQEQPEKKISIYATWGEFEDDFTCWDETKDKFTW